MTLPLPDFFNACLPVQSRLIRQINTGQQWQQRQQNTKSGSHSSLSLSLSFSPFLYRILCMLISSSQLALFPLLLSLSRFLIARPTSADKV